MATELTSENISAMDAFFRWFFIVGGFLFFVTSLRPSRPKDDE